MNAFACDQNELFAAEVRAIQSIHNKAHEALKNWGAWSRDRAGIFPTLAPPAMWEMYRAPEEWAEVEIEEFPDAPIVKAERTNPPSVDEKTANEMDELLHARFPWNIRKCLLVAYVTQEVPEYQFPHHARCTSTDFLMHLDGVLRALCDDVAR